MLQRRLRGSTSTALRLRINAARLIQGDGEDLLLLGQGTRILALLQVRAVAAILCGDDLAVRGVHAHLTRQAQQLKRLLQRDAGRLHRGKERGRARLQLLLDVLSNALFLLLRRGLGLPILGSLALGRALGVLRSALLFNDLLGFGLGLLTLVVTHLLGHIRAETTFLGHDGAAILRVLAQLTPALRGSKELLRQSLVELIRGDRLREVGALVFHRAILVGAHGALNIRPIAAHAHEDIAAFRVGIEAQRVDLAGIDSLQVDIHQGLQAPVAGNGRGLALAGLRVAEVEVIQPVRAVLRSGGNGIELILHRGGEVIVHQLSEVILQQAHHREGNPRGHQRVAAGEHVAAVLDGLDDGGIRRRAPNAQVFHLLDQAGLGIARRRVGGVAVGSHRSGLQRVALVEVRQARLFLGPLRRHVLVGLEEAREGDRAAGRGEIGVVTASAHGRGHLHRGSLGIGHLGGHGAFPNQLVELVLLGVELPGQLARGSKTLAGGADGLVGLLGVLHLAVIGARPVGHELGAENGGRSFPRGVEPLLGQGGRVGTHIGNVTVLVEALRNAHRALRGVVQAASGLLLQRRGHKRRGGFARIRLVLNAGHRHGGAFQRAGQLLRLGLLDHDHLVALQLTPIVEVAARGHAFAIKGAQACVEIRRGF